MDGWIRGRKETGKRPNLFSLLLHQFCCALFAFIFFFFSDSFLLIWPRRRKTTIHSIRAADTRTRCKMDGRGRCGIWSLCFPFCHKSNWASCESASAIKASLGSCPLYDKTDESFFSFSSSPFPQLHSPSIWPLSFNHISEGTPSFLSPDGLFLFAPP